MYKLHSPLDAVVDEAGACLLVMRLLVLLFEDALLVTRLVGLVLLLLLTLTTTLPSDESEKTPLDSVSVDVTISSSLFPLAAACLIVSWLCCW